MNLAVVLSVVLTIAAYVLGLLILAAVIRWAVRKGLEDVLYHRRKDKTWEAHPDLVKAVREIAQESSDRSGASRMNSARE